MGPAQPYSDSTPNTGAEFGKHVATAGSFVLVGASQANAESLTNVGKVYVYMINETTGSLTEMAQLIAGVPKQTGHFGMFCLFETIGKGSRVLDSNRNVILHSRRSMQAPRSASQVRA